MIEVQQQTRVDARRMSVMLHHSMHVLVALLWTLAAAQSWTNGWSARAGAIGFALVYLAGWALRGRARRHAVVGRAWIATMVVLWCGLVTVSTVWTWLGFPLFFLAWFILPGPWAAPAVAAMALWAGLSPLVRGEQIRPGSVLGPIVGALVATITWLVTRQLRRDAAENARLLAQVRAAQDEVVVAAARAARTAERERLAADLHDSLAQGLNSIVLLTRAAQAAHPQADLSLIEATARENLAETRRLVRETARHGEPMSARIAELVDQVRARLEALGSGLQVELRIEGEEPTLPVTTADALVRAAQASLANVTQHARADRAVISLGFWPEAITLDIVDDGIGFDPSRVSEGSYGLEALAGRIAALGGSLEVDTEPGEGTSIGIRIPLATVPAQESP